MYSESVDISLSRDGNNTLQNYAQNLVTVALSYSLSVPMFGLLFISLNLQYNGFKTKYLFTNN